MDNWVARSFLKNKRLRTLILCQGYRESQAHRLTGCYLYVRPFMVKILV